MGGIRLLTGGLAGIGLALAFGGPAAAQVASPVSDTIQDFVGGTLEGSGSLTQAQENNGVTSLFRDIPQRTIFYLQSGGSVSDVVSFKGLVNADNSVRSEMHSDTETTQPVVTNPQPTDLNLRTIGERADLSIQFASDSETNPNSDALAFVLNGTPFDIPGVTTNGGVILSEDNETATITTPRIIVTMVEPDGSNSDLFFLDPMQINITSDTTSLLTGSPGPNDIVIQPNPDGTESSEVIGVLVQSDPEPGTLAVLAVGLAGIGTMARRRRKVP